MKTTHKMLCPCCDTPLEWHPSIPNYKPEDIVTHIYVCPECAFIGLEYLNSKSIEDLKTYLNHK